jgi:hypothetical protein
MDEPAHPIIPSFLHRDLWSPHFSVENYEACYRPIFYEKTVVGISKKAVVLPDRLMIDLN